MEEKKNSGLKQIRESRGLSRKEVAVRSGINFRSLQDYEQGHKCISDAKAETVYRLSLTLGCGMEELLLMQMKEKEKKNKSYWGDYEILLKDSTSMIVESYPNRSNYRVITQYALYINQTILAIESYDICSPQYNVYGRWKMEGEECYLVFCYGGEIVKLPFVIDMKKDMLEWMAEAAGLKIDSYIRNKRFEAGDMLTGGENWDES